MRKRSHSIWTASRENGKASRQSQETNRQRALRASKKNVRACFLVPSLPSVHHANDIRMNGGTYTRTRMHSHAHAPTRADEVNEIAESQWRAIAKLTHTRTRGHTHIRAAKITEKRPPETDDEQLQKGHNYTVIHVHRVAAKINEITVPRWRGTTNKNTNSQAHSYRETDTSALACTHKQMSCQNERRFGFRCNAKFYSSQSWDHTPELSQMLSYSWIFHQSNKKIFLFLFQVPWKKWCWKETLKQGSHALNIFKTTKFWSNDGCKMISISWYCLRFFVALLQ